MGKRVYFEASAHPDRGAGRWDEPAYAVRAGFEPPEQAVARALARKNGLRDGVARLDHQRDGQPVYRVELGQYDRNGGFDRHGHYLFTL